jgi:chromosome segregation ATPase
METLKNNQSEINNLISQIKISIESLTNKVEQVENRVLGMEDKVEELDQTVKDHERIIRTYKWNMQGIRNFATTKPALQKILKGLLHIDEETRVRKEDSRKNKLF